MQNKNKNETELENELTDMSRQTESLEKLQPSVRAFEDAHKIAKSMQNSIDWVRVGIKYLLFDLEATRRENAELRKMLENPPPPMPPQPPPFG